MGGAGRGMARHGRARRGKHKAGEARHGVARPDINKAGKMQSTPQTLLTLALAIERNTAAQCNNRFISLQQASKDYFAGITVPELIHLLETHGAVFPHSKRSGMVDLITIQRVLSRMSTAENTTEKEG